MNMNKLISGVSVLSLTIALSNQIASSQELDYGSMEEIFGQAVTEGATGTPKLASDVPVNMTIISAEEIRRSGARDIPALLRRHAGIDVQKLSQTGALVGIRGRNHDGQRLRVLINGRDTFRSYEGTTLWSSLPVSMEEIRQIEIVRGPATALYGANAVTGVVNIITFSPLYDTANNITARIGDVGVREITGVTTLKFKDAGGIRFSGGYVQMDRFDVTLTPGQSNARVAQPEMKRLSADGLFNLSDRFKLGLEATYFQGDVLSGSYSGLAEVGTAKDHSMRMKLSYESDNMGKWTLQAFSNNNDETRNLVIKTGQGEFISNQTIEAKTTAIELTNAQTVGSTNLRFAVGYQVNKVLQFGNSAADSTGDVGMKTKYISAVADHPFTDKLSVAASVRFDSLASYRTALELVAVPFDNDDFKTYNEFSVNIGMTYKPTDNDTVKLMFARGFEAPNLFALGGQFTITNAFAGVSGIGGHPNLKSAKFTQYELQYIHALPEMAGKLSSSIFYRTEKNLIGRSVLGVLWPRSGGGFYMGSSNIADAKTWGIEFDLSGKQEKGLIWALRYSYAKTTYDFDTSPYTPISAFYPFVRDFYDDRSSKHILTALLGYSSGKLKLDSMIQYKSAYHSYTDFLDIPNVLDPHREIDGVWTANFTATYDLTDKLHVQLVGEGLLNKQRREAVADTLIAQRRVWLGLALDF